jgi:hypothetical protein
VAVRLNNAEEEGNSGQQSPWRDLIQGGTSIWRSVAS